MGETGMLRERPDVGLSIRTRLAVTGAGAGVTVAMAVAFTPSQLNNDAIYALIWGREIAGGRLPDFAIAGAPTPHPLTNFASAFLSPLGTDAAWTAMAWLGFFAVALLAVLVFQIGREIFSVAAGVTAAALVLTRPAFIFDGASARLDIPFACLVLYAMLLELRRPRRGPVVLVLLGLSGLLRPEGWALALAYGLWLILATPTRKGQVRVAALSLAGPVIWVLNDLVVTGNPLWSFTQTKELTDELGRPSGISDVPSAIGRTMDMILGTGGTVVVVLGVLLSVRHRCTGAFLPLAVAAIVLLAFAAQGTAGLALNQRYLYLAGASLAVFAGYTLTGWSQQQGRARGWWQAGAAILALAILSTLPSLVQGSIDQRNRYMLRAEQSSDLREMMTTRWARRALASCRLLAVPPPPDPTSSGTRSAVAWFGERDPDLVMLLTSRPRISNAAAIVPTGGLDALHRLDSRWVGRGRVGRLVMATHGC